MKKNADTQTLAKTKKVAKKREYAAKTDMFCFLVVSQLRVKVEKELKFHPERKWRFDYAIPEYKIAIEVEGGVWTGGRHTRSQGFLGDVEKYNAAAVLGWRLLRVVPTTLMSSNTLQMIHQCIENQKNLSATV